MPLSPGGLPITWMCAKRLKEMTFSSSTPSSRYKQWPTTSNATLRSTRTLFVPWMVTQRQKLRWNDESVT